MKLKTVIAAGFAVSSLSLAGIASAQQQNELPQLQLPPQIQVPAGKQPQLDGLLKAGTARAAGCIKHQVYNIQGLSRVATAFVLTTSSGDQTFNFEGDAIRHIPAGAGLPIASTAETNRWDRVLTTLERAAAADKPLLVDYNLPSREVFGIYVQWEGNCAP